MRVYIRWNKESIQGKQKPWRVIFEESEIICDEVDFVVPAKTEIIDIPNKGFRPHISVDVNEVIYKNGKISFRL